MSFDRCRDVLAIAPSLTLHCIDAVPLEYTNGGEKDYAVQLPRWGAEEAQSALRGDSGHEALLHSTAASGAMVEQAGRRTPRGASFQNAIHFETKNGFRALARANGGIW